MSRQGTVLTILSAQAAVGFGTEVDVSQYKHIGVEISTASSANLTVKCQGSFRAVDDIDFTSAKSASNPWDYVALNDYEDGSLVDGDTGLSFSGTDDVRILEVNTNTIRSLNFHVSARSAGSVTVKIYPINNQ